MSSVCSTSATIEITASVDAEIYLRHVNLQQEPPPDEYTEGNYNFSIWFQYVTGSEPPADSFSFVSGTGLSSLFYRFSPDVPDVEGSPSKLRNGFLHGSVEAPDVGIVHSGIITIHQTDKDPELPRVDGGLMGAIDSALNKITVSWNAPDISNISDALGINEAATFLGYVMTIIADGSPVVTRRELPASIQQLELTDSILAPYLDGGGSRIGVEVEVAPRYEITNTLVPNANSGQPTWTRHPNGGVLIYLGDGTLFRTSPFGTDIQRLASGAYLMIEPNGTRIKIPPPGVTAKLHLLGGLSKSTWQYPVDVWGPSVPQDFRANQTGAVSVRLTWRSPADTGNAIITGYQIAYKEAGTIFWGDNINVAARPRQYDLNLSSHKTYDFSIRATNGEGRYSTRAYASIVITST